MIHKLDGFCEKMTKSSMAFTKIMSPSHSHRLGLFRIVIGGV